MSKNITLRDSQSLESIINDVSKFPLLTVEQEVQLANRIKNGEDFVKPDGTVVPWQRLTTDAEPPRSYAFISDTLPLKAVASEVKGVDLLYHEATFAESEA